MAEHVLTFTDQNFETEVLKSDALTMVYFWASWCGPCRVAAPIIDRVADALAGKKVKIGKLNVDESSTTAQHYNVMSIPTFLVFKKGAVVEQMVGVPNESSLKAKLEGYLAE